MNARQLWRQRWILGVLVLGQGIILDSLFASDALAINEIFAEQHAEESAWTIHRQVAEMSAEHRFEFLTNWILPGETHDTWRLQFAFSPTNPIDPKASQGTGGELVSPVFDWLEKACELGELDAVMEKIRSMQTDGIDERISQLAVQILAESYRGDTEQLESNLLEFIATAPIDLQTGPSDAEWLVCERCLRRGINRDAIAHAVFRYMPWVWERYTPTVDRQHWTRFYGLTRRTLVETLPEEERPEVHSHRHWQMASPSSARCNGEGRPTAQWDMHTGLIENLVSYDQDYLFYAVPLRGTFQVECEVSAFERRDTQLLIGERWASPSYRRDEYEFGNFRTQFGNEKLPRRMTSPEDWLRIRVTVDENIVTTCANGLEIHREVDRHVISPWMAIRSDVRRDGGVRNLRITGEPTIPDSIELLADPDLSGWTSYFDVPVGPRPGGWKNNNGVLETEMAAVPGQHVEQLLHYQRPLYEDGVIEYEFYYEPDRFHTHPAIGRLAFLMHPDGVKLHWVTNGRHDRTAADPTNVSIEPKHQLTTELPLQPDAWNRTRVELKDDTLTLSLNDQPVYRRTLEPTNPRTFGFFTWIDRSRVKVRNVVHRGEWPKKLPDLSQQEMAVEDYDPFDGDTEHLTEAFDFDFAKRPLWQQSFELLQGNVSRNTEFTEHGLVVSRSTKSGYRNVSLAPKLRLKGDFDLVAEFEQYEPETSPGGTSNIYLIVLFDTPAGDEHFVTRRKSHDEDGTIRHVCQSAIVRRSPARRNHFSITAMEEHAGKLRITRHGETISYFTSQEDSPFFQRRGQIESLADGADVKEIRLVGQIYQEGSFRVVWKSLKIQAEHITGEALETSRLDLASLNEKRDALPDQYSRDFTKNGPTNNFVLRSNTPPWNAKDRGWKITSSGTRQWTATGFQTQNHIEGDFDLSMKFDVPKFPEFGKGQLSSIYLQIELPGSPSKQISAVYDAKSSGQSVRGHRGVQEESRAWNYSDFGRVSLQDVTELRVCRYGTVLALLAKSEELDEEVIISYRVVDKTPLPPQHIRLMVHTTGEDLKTELLLKSVDFRADKIITIEEPNRPVQRMNNKPIKPKPSNSLFDTLRNLFR